MPKSLAWSFVACSLLVCACATGRPPNGRGVGGYDSVDSQQCAADRQDPSLLVVRVTDESGAAIPGIPVHLLDAGTHGTVPSPASAVTDDGGIARLQVPGGRYYSLLVSFVGFAPEVRLLPLQNGCEGNVAITLRVLALDGLEVQGEDPR